MLPAGRPGDWACGLLEQRCALKFCPVAEMDDLKNEIGMQCLSKHPNIVTLREAFVTKTEVRCQVLLVGICRTGSERRAGGGEARRKVTIFFF